MGKQRDVINLIAKQTSPSQAGGVGLNTSNTMLNCERVSVSETGMVWGAPFPPSRV